MRLYDAIVTPTTLRWWGSLRTGHPGPRGSTRARCPAGRCSGGGVDLVLAQDRDSFSREPAHHYVLGKEFLQHGTSLKALNDYGDDSPEGVLTDGILDQLAKFERAKTAERTRRGRMRKAQEGKIVGTGKVPTGSTMPTTTTTSIKIACLGP